MFIFTSIFTHFELFHFLGYGDIFPETVPAKILTSIIVLLGFSLIPAQVRSERDKMVIEYMIKERKDRVVEMEEVEKRESGEDCDMVIEEEEKRESGERNDA